MTLRITHFNFIRFKPSLDVEKQSIPAHTALEGLWKHALGVMSIIPPSVAKSGFVAAIRNWRDEIAAAQAAMKGLPIPHNVAVSGDSITALERGSNDLAERIDSLEKRRGNAGALILSEGRGIAGKYYAQMLFDNTLEQHRTTVQTLNALISAVGEMRDGRVENLGVFESGTAVAVRIHVEALEDDATAKTTAYAAGVTTVRFNVSPRMPVDFHAGLSYYRLKETEFVQVREVTGGDLFREIAKPDDSSALVAFMTYRFASPRSLLGRIGLTVGTGLRKPGERLYLGGSLRFGRRIFLSGGTVTMEVKEGVNSVSADLFETLRSTRKWGGFFAISATPL